MTNHPSKIAALTFSFIATLFITPFLVFLIQFERDNHNRTLINQYISSIMWIGIIWNLIMQPVTFYRYMIGPLYSQFLCGLDSVMRNGLSMHAMLMFDAIIIARCAYLHCLKNPTALQDDYWKMFTNLWITAFWFVTQTVYIITPGKNPINYYMCTGTYPSEFKNQPVKVNLSMLYVTLFSIALHLGAAAVNLKPNSSVEQKSLFSKATNNIGMTSLMCVSLLLPAVINQKEPEELDQYPNYLLLYALHQYLSETNMMVVTLSYFFLTNSLRNRFVTELKSVYRKVFSVENEVAVII